MPYWLVTGLPEQSAPPGTPTLSFRAFQAEDEAQRADPHDHSAVVFAMDTDRAAWTAFRAKGLRPPPGLRPPTT
ncbi:MAG: hypothetical protein ACYDCQ_20015 [Dehalococcoidia bacterium]